MQRKTVTLQDSYNCDTKKLKCSALTVFEGNSQSF